MTEWCTYKSTHPTGFYYYGKGKTQRVQNGEYRGSGIRFKLSLETDAFAWDTWTTTVLETFASEEEAYAAEAVLVPLELLKDPYCLNMTAGGSKGKYQGHSALLKKYNSAKKMAARKAKADSARAKKAAAATKLRELKLALRKKK